jgi:hypothetical protein
MNAHAFRVDGAIAVNVRVPARGSLLVEPDECSGEVVGIPQHNGVEDETEVAELVFLAVAVGLAHLPHRPWKIGRAKAVPRLVQGERGVDLAATSVLGVE